MVLFDFRRRSFCLSSFFKGEINFRALFEDDSGGGTKEE
jgi:hypothetical protein